jgi:hypothetical protein
MAVVEGGLHGLREALRDAGKESRLDVLFLQNPQQPVDRIVWSVFTLAPHFVIENVVLVRLHVLAALEVEGQKHGGPLAAWITATFLADLAERARTVLVDRREPPSSLRSFVETSSAVALAM